jgi:WD40 repeat protein
MSADRSRLVTGGQGYKATIHALRSEIWSPVLEVNSEAEFIGCAALNSAQTQLAIGTNYARGVELWDLSKEPPTRLGHVECVDVPLQVIFCANDNLIIVRDGGGRIRVFCVTNGVLEELETPEIGEHFYDLAVSPDGNELATVGLYRGDVWSLSESGATHVRRIHNNETEGHYATAVSYSPDGARIVLGSFKGGQGRVRILDRHTGVVDKDITIPGYVIKVHYLDDRRHVMTANGNGTIYILRPDATGQPKQE